MAALKYNLLFLFAVSSCSQVTSNSQITIDNKLSDCIGISQSALVFREGIPILKVWYQQKKITAECGCTSAITAYSSELEMDEYKSQLMNANFTFDKGEVRIHSYRH